MELGENNAAGKATGTWEVWHVNGHLCCRVDLFLWEGSLLTDKNFLLNYNKACLDYRRFCSMTILFSPLQL